MLSEREAWLYIAEQIDQGRPGNCTFIVGDRDVVGLCAAIGSLFYSARLIYRDTSLRMEQRIHDYKGNPFGAFKWPLTPKGREQRRLFCLAQAEACEATNNSTPPAKKDDETQYAVDARN